MIHPTSHSDDSSLPVFYVHAKGRGPACAEDFEALLPLAGALCSKLGGEGVVQTEHGYDDQVRLLAELSVRFPGRPVVFVRAGLAPTAEQMSGLCALMGLQDGPAALTLLSNAEVSLNPYAGLEGPEDGFGLDPAELVALLAPGRLHEPAHWTDHFVLLSPDTVRRMASVSGGDTILQRLESVAGRLLAPDYLFVHDRASRLFMPRTLQPWESLYPPPFGELSARLQQWIDAGVRQFPLPAPGGRSATLHVTHNWGGGVAHWIDTFIKTDGSNRHFQLRAEGPQSGMGCGQRLSLYAGTETACPVASWWLQPPIRSVEDEWPAYREVLEDVCRRYGIGRIIVSSLIGHSLDVLRSGLPTLQVLHDHFPLWPLLSVHPQPFLREGSAVDLDAALSSRPGQLEFTDKVAAGWNDIREAYLAALKDNDIQIVAPGQSVLDMQARLEPAFDTQSAHVIPHGSGSLAGNAAVEPRSRKDGRLRMVILGRIQTGKGQKLLLQALEALAEHVQVYLLGSGKSGEAFFGRFGIDVVPEYRHEDLPELLRDIGPDFAALLSIVPETFSYTLSELKGQGIPAIATRVGSFPDRIVHGETGWLVDPDPQALIAQVAELCRSPGSIESVRARLQTEHPGSPEEMLAAYEQVFPVPGAGRISVPAMPGSAEVQVAASNYQLAQARQQLERAGTEREELRQELHDRTERLSGELENRTQWAKDTKRQLEREHEVRREAEQTLATTRASLAELEYRHGRLARQHEEVLGSSSWKITKPLRAFRRVLNNFMQARAWNPLRWPRLLSNFVGNLSRAGLRGALQGMQYGSASLRPDVPERLEAAVPDVAPPESFPEIESPDVSIVIPVHNKWAYTAACLKSLAETPGVYTFEVIVVDDASADESRERLSAIGGVAYLRNEENLGFVGSCNRGAGSARGEYLVFLNNDTEVTDGWLDALIDTLKNEPGAGLVGSRLVYPDGSLQEAGGIIYADGSGWNYGRDEAADNPSYNFLREADYCSGASIALKTSLFRDLGAFDERYAPAYYEDTDLAFRVREAGLKVFVQPASSVIHHEGVTSGTDTSSGMKKYQVVNQSKFAERWREALQSQPAAVNDRNAHAKLRAASQHRVKGRVLVIAPASGGKPAMERLDVMLHCCRGLGYGVTLAAHGGSFPQDERLRLQRNGIEVVHGAWLDSLPDFLDKHGDGFGNILIVHPEVAAGMLSLARKTCPGCRVAVDMHGMHFISADGKDMSHSVEAARLLRHSELRLARDADLLLAGTEVEKNVLRDAAPGSEVVVFAPSGGSDCEQLVRLFEPAG